jgi:hypothetical protein
MLRPLLFAAFGVLAFAPPAGAAPVPVGEIAAILPERNLVKIANLRVEVGDRVGIFARNTDEALGYGVVQKVRKESNEALAEISLHERAQLIIPGDTVRVINTEDGAEHWPGRVDLQIDGDRRVSSRYKSLAYYGPLIGEGHPVDQGEWLIDILLFKLEYGLTSRLSVSISPLASVAAPNLSLKARVMDNDFVKATVIVSGVHLLDSHKNVAGARVLLSFPTNTKIISHLEAGIGAEFYFGEPPVEAPMPMPEGEEMATAGGTSVGGIANARASTSLRSFTEYIFDNWDRIVGGPIYDFDIGALGGFLSYMIVAESFHMGLGFSTRDFRNFKLSADKGYFPNIAMFWRF